VPSLHTVRVQLCNSLLMHSPSFSRRSWSTEEFGIKNDPKAYHYTRQSGCFDVTGVVDKDDFKECKVRTRAAPSNLGNTSLTGPASECPYIRPLAVRHERDRLQAGRH